MATEILKIIPVPEDGLEIHVAKIDRGFSVAVKDTDADEFYPFGKIFPDLDRALAYTETANVPGITSVVL